MTADRPERPRHPDSACAKLLVDLLPDLPGPDEDALEPGDLEPETIVELLGRALWDIFSDNHAVVDSEGTAYDLGSFRSSGDFIARILNERYPWLPQRCGYLDFYMGGALLRGRVDLTPFHRWVFSRLRATGCDWVYSFPRLHIIDLSGPAQALDDELDYDPSEAVARELGERERREKLEALSSRLEDAYQDAVRQARHEALPDTVMAYREVFGVLPRGWPHPDM